MLGEGTLAGAEPSDREGAVFAIEELIRTGGYRPGDRLPPEREMIVSLGVSRNTLRKALEVLEFRGEIWRHVGKGTFVSTGQQTLGALTDLAKQVSPVHMMRARLSLEPAIAREAAVNASEEAVQRIHRARELAQNAPGWDEYEMHDDAFHRSVAEATGNVLLLALFDQLNMVRRAVAWNSVVRQTDRPPRNHTSFTEHDQIAAAIEARDPAVAHSAMRKHLGSVSARLFGEV